LTRHWAASSAAIPVMTKSSFEEVGSEGEQIDQDLLAPFVRRHRNELAERVDEVADLAVLAERLHRAARRQPVDRMARPLAGEHLVAADLAPADRRRVVDGGLPVELGARVGERGAHPARPLANHGCIPCRSFAPPRLSWARAKKVLW
jgi:hypothetical protein